MSESNCWLAYRRDHHGNRVLLRKSDGISPAWDLTEAQADRVIERLKERQSKPHGQEYIKISYPRHERETILESNYIAV